MIYLVSFFQIHFAAQLAEGQVTLDFGGGRNRSWRQLREMLVRFDSVMLHSFLNRYFMETSPVSPDCLQDLPLGRHSSGLGICLSVGTADVWLWWLTWSHFACWASVFRIVQWGEEQQPGGMSQGRE